MFLLVFVCIQFKPRMFYLLGSISFINFIYCVKDLQHLPKNHYRFTCTSASCLLLNSPGLQASMMDHHTLETWFASTKSCFVTVCSNEELFSNWLHHDNPTCLQLVCLLLYAGNVFLGLSLASVPIVRQQRSAMSKYNKRTFICHIMTYLII